jgi:hypothetical protein
MLFPRSSAQFSSWHKDPMNMITGSITLFIVALLLSAPIIVAARYVPAINMARSNAPDNNVLTSPHGQRK